MQIGKQVTNIGRSGRVTAAKDINVLRNLNFEPSQFYTSWNSAGVNIALARPFYTQFFDAFAYTGSYFNPTPLVKYLRWGGSDYGTTIGAPYICEDIYTHNPLIITDDPFLGYANDTILIRKPGKYIVLFRVTTSYSKTNYTSSEGTSIGGFFNSLFANFYTKSGTALNYGTQICAGSIWPDAHMLQIADHVIDGVNYSHTFDWFTNNHVSDTTFGDVRSGTIHAIIDQDTDLVDGIFKVGIINTSSNFEVMGLSTQLSIVGPFQSYTKKAVKG